MSSAAVTLQGVARSFGPQKALVDVDLAVPAGAVLGLVGPNGAGKTTLVRLLTGLLRPDAGKLAVLGHDPWRDGDAVRARTGVLTELAGHYRHLTALEELAFFAHLHAVSQPQVVARTWLEAVGLGAALHQKVGSFSTGMARRLGVARALLHQPQLILLDEPTSGLDPGGIRHVLALLAHEAATRGATVILCSHVLAQLQSVCTRYAVLDRGHLKATGTFDELADASGLPLRLQLRLRGAVPTAVLGVPLERSDDGDFSIALQDSAQIPAMIAALAAQCDVYHAALRDRDLEQVYFAVVGRRT